MDAEYPEAGNSDYCHDDSGVERNVDRKAPEGYGTKDDDAKSQWSSAMIMARLPVRTSSTAPPNVPVTTPRRMAAGAGVWYSTAFWTPMPTSKPIPQGINVQQLRLAHAGIRGAPGSAMSGSTASRQPTSRSFTPSYAVRALGVASPCPARRSATSMGCCTTPSTIAVRIGYIARNPTDAIDRPRNDTEERPVYTPDQVRCFMLAADDDRLGAMWYLLLATGLRRAELAGLRWR